MPAGFQSTLLLTVLMAIGLVFFLRAASKDRTTVVDVHSPKPALVVLSGLSEWLEQRGWSRNGGDAERQVLRFQGAVASSRPLAVLLSVLAAIGGTCFGLVLRQLAPQLSWWPLLMILLGPVAGVVYSRRAARTEAPPRGACRAQAICSTHPRAQRGRKAARAERRAAPRSKLPMRSPRPPCGTPLRAQ